MWAGCRSWPARLWAPPSEAVVTLVAPASLEATPAECGHGGAKHPSLQSSHPRGGLSEIRRENALPLGKGATPRVCPAARGRGLGGGQARGSGAGWGVPVADGGASLGQRTRTQGGLASSTLILARFHLAFDFHGNIL